MAIHLRRREFIVTLGGAAAWPLTARAQQDQRVRRIGVLMGDAENDPEARAVVAAFREELQKLGWTEGRNIGIDTRWAAADIEAMKRFAKELVALAARTHSFANTPATAACWNKHIPSRRVRSGYRSGRQRFRREHSAPGRQCHRFYHDGADDGRQVAGDAQGDCAARPTGRIIVQSGNGAIFRILSEPLQSCRCVLRQWRRSPPLLATCPSSNPLLPHRRASRTAA